MQTRLAQIDVEKESDLLEVHQLALTVAQWTGLSVLEQIRFASAVIEKCISTREKKYQVSFDLEKHIQRYSLKASVGLDSTGIEQLLDENRMVDQLPLKQNTGRKDARWEENYRDMQQFTFAMAHDLKNSLTKLKLALAILNDEELQPPVNTYIKIISRAAERFEGITMSLNKIIQLDNTTAAIVKKLSPQDVFADVREEFVENLEEAGATVDIDFSQLPCFNYIEVYLKSIFSNLLSNAIKYTSAARPLHIEISGHKENDKIIIRFSDNGQGIDLDIQAVNCLHRSCDFQTRLMAPASVCT